MFNSAVGPIEISAALLVYLFFSFCLFKIAVKAGLQQRAWWGWIPILQVFLMLQVAGVPWWWIFLFLIPFVNLVIGIVMWVKIAKKMSKPWWTGILMFVPGVDLFVLGYLAFSR